MLLVQREHLRKIEHTPASCDVHTVHAHTHTHAHTRRHTCSSTSGVSTLHHVVLNDTMKYGVIKVALQTQLHKVAHGLHGSK